MLRGRGARFRPASPQGAAVRSKRMSIALSVYETACDVSFSLVASCAMHALLV